MKKKIITTTLLIIWLAVIFTFSSMNTDESNGKSKKTIEHAIQKTAEISETVNKKTEQPSQKKIDSTVDELNLPLRKCAHATEYAILAIIVILVINAYTNKQFSLKIAIMVVVFCFAYSLTDEFHQSFVSGRTSSFFDCLIDTGGSIIGCGAYAVGRMIIRKIRNKKHEV